MCEAREYDYDRELFYHVGPWGFRFKVQDILLVMGLFAVLAAIAGFEALALLIARVRQQGGEEKPVPVMPLQEVPGFRSHMYSVRETAKKTAKKKIAAGKLEQPGDELVECMVCGFKLGRAK